MPLRPHEKAARAADLLHRAIDRFMKEIAPRDHRIAIDIARAEQHPSDQETTVECEMVFGLPDGRHMDSHLAVANFGGNVYEVTARVADGEPYTCSVTMPDVELSAEAVGTYAREICHHLLNELMRKDGEQSLQEKTAAARQKQDP